MNALAVVRVVAIFALSTIFGNGAHAAPGDGGGNAPISLTLKNEFIAQFKNRATISEVVFHVDQVHKQPNPRFKDGDLHVAGRTDAVGLPLRFRTDPISSKVTM
jgi:hypothetical protein